MRRLGDYIYNLKNSLKFAHSNVGEVTIHCTARSGMGRSESRGDGTSFPVDVKNLQLRHWFDREPALGSLSVHRDLCKMPRWSRQTLHQCAWKSNSNAEMTESVTQLCWHAQASFASQVCTSFLMGNGLS